MIVLKAMAAGESAARIIMRVMNCIMSKPNAQNCIVEGILNTVPEVLIDRGR